MSEEITGWQPIETAPKDGTRVLLVQTVPGDYIGVQSVGSWIEGQYRRYVPRVDDPLVADLKTGTTGMWAAEASGLNPSHWMPLPPPPGGSDG